MIANGVVPQQPSLETLEPDPFACPVCGRTDRVEKVSSVVKQQSGEFIFDGYRGARAYQTALAMELAPPELPHAPSWASTAGRLAFSAALGLVALGTPLILDDFAVELPKPGPDVLAVLAVAFLAVLPGLFITYAGIAHFLASRRKPDWQAALERWQKLYFCYRDDVVFVSGAADYYPAAATREVVAGALH